MTTSRARKVSGKQLQNLESVQTESTRNESTKGLKSMTTDGVQPFFLFLASSLRRIRRERHDGPESEKAKQAVVCVRRVKMAASRRIQKQPECKMFGARGTYMVKRETTPMIFWAEFQWRFVPGGWNMTKNRLGAWLGEPMCFFFVGMRSSGTSIRKQAGLLIAGRTSLTFIQLRLKTERGTQQNTLGCREQARYPIESHQYHVNLTASIKTFEQISKYPSSSRYTLEN